MASEWRGLVCWQADCQYVTHQTTLYMQVCPVHGTTLTPIILVPKPFPSDA